LGCWEDDQRGIQQHAPKNQRWWGILISIPDDESTINTGSTESTSLVSLNAIDSVLMFGRQLGFYGRGRSLVDLVLEHLESSILLCSSSSSSGTGGSTSGIDLLGELPGTLLREDDRGAIVTDGDDGIFGDEEEILEGEFSVFDYIYTGLTRGHISNTNSGVLASEGKLVSRGRPLDSLYPARAVVHFNERISSKGNVTKRSGGHLLVHSLDVSAKDSALEVGGGSSQENVVGMPVNLDNGRLVLLDVFADPPIVVLFKVAHAHTFGSGSNGKLVLFGNPFYVSSSSVNTEDYKYGFPFVGVQSPYVSVTIVRARHDSVGLGSPIDSSYNLVVLGEFGLEDVVVSLFGVDVDLIVVGAKGDLCAISVPSVARNARS